MEDGLNPLINRLRRQPKASYRASLPQDCKTQQGLQLASYIQDMWSQTGLRKTGD